jgi:hypothetical protein
VRAIVAARKIVEPVIVNVETVEVRKFQGAGGSNDASTHASKMVMTGVVVKWTECLSPCKEPAGANLVRLELWAG